MTSPTFVEKSESMISSQRFILFLKVREISAVNCALKIALNLPLKKQREWAGEYGSIIDHALNTFINDSNIVLENLSLDDETLELSEKLIVGLKSALKSIDKILGPHEELKS